MLNTNKIVVLSAVAAALSVGAVQFASGHDLTGGLFTPASTSSSVNRSAKADRAPVQAFVGQTKTISLHLSQFADTSFVLRVPAAHLPTGAARDTGTTVSPSRLLIKSEGTKDAKRPIACEPSVSILTEIAKSLQPGRCVT